MGLAKRTDIPVKKVKLNTIGVGDTFYAPDERTKVQKVWIVQRREVKQIRASRRDGRFAFFAPDLEVETGPRPRGKNNV